MATVTSININSRRLTYWWAGYRCTLDYDDEYLTWTKECFPERFVTKSPLWRVIPEIIVDRSIPPGLRISGRQGLFFILAALVVLWSDIPSHVPLLAPVLLLLGIWYSLVLFRACWKYEKRPFEASKLVTEFGEELAAIPHYAYLREERIDFEEQLMGKVADARRKHYGE